MTFIYVISKNLVAQKYIQLSTVKATLNHNSQYVPRHEILFHNQTIECFLQQLGNAWTDIIGN